MCRFYLSESKLSTVVTFAELFEGYGWHRKWVWRERYESYLLSEEWAEMREAVSYRCKGKCQCCGDTGSELHHRSYERLGRERPADLEWLCTECHNRQHGRRPVTVAPPCAVCGSKLLRHQMRRSDHQLHATVFYCPKCAGKPPRYV